MLQQRQHFCSFSLGVCMQSIGHVLATSMIITNVCSCPSMAATCCGRCCRPCGSYVMVIINCKRILWGGGGRSNNSDELMPICSGIYSMLLGWRGAIFFCMLRYQNVLYKVLCGYHAVVGDDCTTYLCFGQELPSEPSISHMTIVYHLCVEHCLLVEHSGHDYCHHQFIFCTLS